MAENIVELLTDVADAIREKKGSTEPINAQNFSTEIRNLPSGGEQPSVEEKDVNFYDYEGTLLFSYTLAEAQALTELPTPKGHEGLVFDGWNWDYEDVIALDYPMDIGALYVTDDGKTRLYVTLDSDKAKDIELILYLNVDSQVLIDWGDGTQESTSGYYSVNIPHSYEEQGEYVISLSCVRGTYEFSTGVRESVLGTFFAHGERRGILRKVELGNNLNCLAAYSFNSQNNLVSISIPSYIKVMGNYVFAKTSLKCVVLPKGVSQIANYAFWYSKIEVICFSNAVVSTGTQSIAFCLVKNLCLPSSITSLGNQTFQSSLALSILFQDNIISLPMNCCHQCRLAKRIDLPSNLSSMGNYAIGDCESLEYLVIPKNISSIGNYAIYGCSSVAYIDFSQCTAIPTLAASTSIGNLHIESKIIVPDALYDQWIVATNWTTHKDRIVKNSEYIRPL